MMTSSALTKKERKKIEVEAEELMDLDPTLSWDQALELAEILVESDELYGDDIRRSFAEVPDEAMPLYDEDF